MVITDGSGFCFVGVIVRKVIDSDSILFFIKFDQVNFANQLHHQDPFSIVCYVDYFNVRCVEWNTDGGYENGPVVSIDDSLIKD